MFQLRLPASRFRSGELKRFVLRPFQTSQHAAEIPQEERYIQKAEVERFMIDCMEKMNTPKDKAAMIAANLSEADYRGHFSHGLNRLTMYVKDIEKECCDPRADPVVLKEGPCTAWVDGNNGLGVVVGTFSMKLAIRKAKEVGVGWVVAKHSNHFGICQWYSEMAMAEGLVGIASTNTSPLVAPTRAKNVVFGTNPFCVGAPAGKAGDSFLIDMSTSAVAVGKIEMQMRKHEKLPSLGWALGADGKPTTDAHEAFYKGAGLMPLGGDEINSGYKGYGLAMFVELICGLMSGSKYAHQIRSWVQYDGKADLGHCFVAVDPECFAPGLGDRLQDLMLHLRNLAPLNPDKPVLVPGDPERLSIKHVENIGAIFYTEDHIRTYRELASELQVKPMQHFKSS